MDLNDKTRLIKQEAQRLGFLHCGIAKAEVLTEDAQRLENWLKHQYQGKMAYMENHFDLRVNPQKLVPGAKSVISLIFNYYPEAEQQEQAPKISKYAWGIDYHYIIREKLNSLLDFIKEHIGHIEGRGFVDSAPVLEKAWAKKSGLGWVGKNALLINPKHGSFFFIASLISDLELSIDPPFQSNHCGTCTRCIDACPTEAIIGNALIDASKCISYLTIELKDELIPTAYKGKMEGWAFGCDICQDVCPWNKFSTATTEPHFKPIPEVLNLSLSEWEEMTAAEFKKIFKSSALSRTKWQGMQRNLKAIKLS